MTSSAKSGVCPKTHRWTLMTEKMDTDSVPDGREVRLEKGLLPLCPLPFLTAPKPLGLKLSWGSSSAGSQSTLQYRVSAVICFSCYFLLGGKN